jgi:hypothetical protein
MLLQTLKRDEEHKPQSILFDMLGLNEHESECISHIRVDSR